MAGRPPQRVALIVEQALGHATHAENLRQALANDTRVDARFALIPYEVGGLGARLPLFRSNWTVRAGLRARRALRAIAAEGPIDALFVHTQVPAVLASDWLRRVPSIVSLDATPLQYDELGASYAHARGPEWLERLKYRLNRRAFHSASHVVAWSSWARRGVVQGYGVPPERVSVIAPGVHTAQWARAQPRAAHDGPVRLLFVGADAGRKGGLLLVEAVRRARADLQVELDLVTRSPIAAEAGIRVHHDIRANSPELRALYHAADAFCLPTEGDCLPMVLAEAAASGLPSIATDVAGIPELVRDGETGLLVSPRDLDALAAAIRRLACSPHDRLTMGERALQLAREEHDAGRNATRIVDLLVALPPRR